MNIVPLNTIVELNKLLKEKNIKIHIKDACGTQSMWIEPLNNQEIGGEVYDFLNEYFKNECMELKYCPDKITFWVAN